MFSSIANIAKNGASPIVSKILMAVLVIMVTIMGFLAWKLYTGQVEITTLTEANTQLQANSQILKANAGVLQTSVEDLKKELEDQKKRHNLTLKAYAELEKKSKQDEKNAEEFRKKLSDIMRDIQSEEGKILNKTVPDRIIDLYNAGNRRLRDDEENDGDSRP